MALSFDRRGFLRVASLAGAASAFPVLGQEESEDKAGDPWAADGLAVPDEGWTLWLDEEAQWEDDAIYLPGEFDLKALPVNAPTGGWHRLEKTAPERTVSPVTLPATVEQYFWGATGTRSYTPEEYRYAADDAVPQNGAYRGVSWFWREIELPKEMFGKRMLLDVRGARMRAEVYLNHTLVGYSIMEELPFFCDLTHAAKPGEKNLLAIRITNPGGRYDWVDGTTIRWGAVNLYRSHGFGGLDRNLRVRAVPMAGHIEDLWVLNRPEPRTITVNAKLAGAKDATVSLEVVDPESGLTLASGEAKRIASPDGADVSARMTAATAHVWDLDQPKLYQVKATLHTAGGEMDVRTTTFGFRWFAPEGIGSDAVFRMNGRRIKLYTSISWGFWGHNGLFPTRELAEREVTQARRLNLNCLNFHRNVGKEEVFRAHDRLGLLRYMEPGGGKLSIGKLPDGVAANAAGIVMQRPKDAADQFSRRFMLEKCRSMVRAYRSHPSLIQYTLQNELGADLKNPASLEALAIMHQEDPSRCVVLNDGFSPAPRNAAQAWYAPYRDEMHRSDREAWGGWWNNHQGAGDQWYDRFYRNAQDFTYRQPLKESLVEFGEMEGCAVADNHALMSHQIETKQFGGSGSSYDQKDHHDIAAAYERYFDRWGFRKAFPTADSFFRSLGDKCYASWQQYMENVRICDEVDFAAISGWESTSIENHSGIVDNLRNFKGDPDLIASSLLPVRPVAKQHALCYALGKTAMFDLYLLNDTGRAVPGTMRFEVIDPADRRTVLKTWESPANRTDQFSYTIATNVETPPLTIAGVHRFRLVCESIPSATCDRVIWVADTAMPLGTKRLRVGVSGPVAAVRRQLASLDGIEVIPFDSGSRFDVIVASGVVAGSKLDRQVGEETGLEAPPVKGAPLSPQVAGELSVEVLAAVRAGTPLLAMVPDDFLADGVAKQLAALGAFTYRGQVGDTRAPWMGNWLFVREHPTFAGLPANRALGVHYQAPGKQTNGLLVDRAQGAPDLDVIMGYSRDHDRNIGAASFVCRLGHTPVLVHRAAEFSLPLQLRWLANSLAYLTGQRSTTHSSLGTMPHESD